MELYHLLKGRYLVGDLLKEGAHSHIYRAYDSTLDQEVAIKEFVPPDPDRAEEDTERFVKEAGVFFGGHEYQGLAEVIDVFRDGDKAYMAMEYLPRKNLREYLSSEKRGHITAEDAWKLLLPVLETVSWMHSIGMIHGGITMGRLIFDENEKLCLTGVGDCFLRKEKTEVAGPWTDVQAVAEILYECLTGRIPSQAGRFWNKKKVRSVRTWNTVSARVDETLLRELNQGVGGGYFGLYALAEQLGMQNGSLAVSLGAIQSIWGEQWLNLTEKYQKEAEWEEKRAFLTRKQWKLLLGTTGILLGSVMIVGTAAFWFVQTHERQVLEWQIQRDHKKYQNKTDGFTISSTHLEKLAGQIFGDSLIKKGSQEQMDITSTKDGRNVESCNFVLSEEEMKLFFREIFPLIVPETYLTEQEIDRTLPKGEEYYQFLPHGKFQMIIWKKEAYEANAQEDEQDWYQLTLNSCIQDTSDEDAAAGSYARDSKEYEEFMDFVKEHAGKTEKTSDTVVYDLTEEAVRKWNQASNVPLLKKTRSDFMNALESSGCAFEKTSEEKVFQVTDFGIGALKTEFLRNEWFKTADGDKIFLQYDLLTERIARVNMGSADYDKEWDYTLAAKLICGLSDDDGETEGAAAKELRDSVSEMQKSSVTQKDYSDLCWMIYTDSENVARLSLEPHGVLDDRSHPYAESRWTQNGEN